MALQTTDNIIVHTGDGIQLEFPYNFRVDNEEDLLVALSGVQVDPTEYVVTGIGDDDGGLVTFVTAPGVGVRTTLARVVPATQELVYPDYGPFPAKSHEFALDKLTMLVQQSISNKQVAITVPPTEVGQVDLVAPPIEFRRNKVLSFDDEGNVTVASGPGESSGTIVGVSRGDSGYLDTTAMLRVDNTTGGQRLPLISITPPNVANALIQLTPAGAIPDQVLAQSPFTLGVDPENVGGIELLTAARTPEAVEVVGVYAPNTADHLMTLDGLGAIPEAIVNTTGLLKDVAPEIIPDGGGTGVDLNLLTVIRSGTTETIGVNNPNTPYYLLSLDSVGAIPAAVVGASGLLTEIEVLVQGGVYLLTATKAGSVETLSVNEPNTANRLMILNGVAGIPDAILESSTVIRNIVPSVIVDGGGAGVDVELLTAIYTAGGVETVGVKNPNTPNQLLMLDPSGSILPEIYERSNVVRNIVPEVLVDGGGTGIDVELLTATHASGGKETIGVSAPNQADRLLQLDHFGQVPAEVLRLQGLRNRGSYRGDDECDKLGDEAGDCTAPDYRDPTERFPSLDPLLYDDPDGTPSVPPNPAPSAAWQAGDFFSIHNGLDGVGGTLPDGSINLWHSDGGAPAAWVREPVLVSPSDGIQFLPEVLDPNDGITVLFPEGWYHLPDRFNLTTASLVSLIPLPNFITGDNVQIGLQQADTQLLANSNASAAAQATADQAIIDAGTAQAAAVAAQGTADQAILDAATAQSTADTANGTANTALSNAATAQGTADQAILDAATAQGVADTALANAATALTAAGNAQTTADQAILDAAAAAGDATQALADAATAQARADLAVTNAATAQARADLAVTNAATAQGVADAALANASTAQTAAEVAQSTVDTHLLDMDDPHGVTPAQIGAEPANANIQTHISSTGNVHGATAGQVGAPAGSWSWDVGTSTLYITVT